MFLFAGGTWFFLTYVFIYQKKLNCAQPPPPPTLNLSWFVNISFCWGWFDLSVFQLKVVFPSPIKNDGVFSLEINWLRAPELSLNYFLAKIENRKKVISGCLFILRMKNVLSIEMNKWKKTKINIGF